MFLFKKKDKKPTENKEKHQEIILTDDDIKNLVSKIDFLLTQEKSVENLETIADLYYQIGDVDKAIEMYEERLDIDTVMGKAYIELPKLYNLKRREAAENKDTEAIQLYLDKMDAVLKMSKDKVRGRI